VLEIFFSLLVGQYILSAYLLPGMWYHPFTTRVGSTVRL